MHLLVDFAISKIFPLLTLSLMFPKGRQSQMHLVYKDEILKTGFAYCQEGLFLEKKMSPQKCSYFQNLEGIEPFQLPTSGFYLPCSM